MKRSKESHELPQGLTPRPYQPGSSTVLFIALNRAPTVRGRAIVPPREPIVSYTSLLRLDRAVIYRDIKPGPNYRRVIAQFGSDGGVNKKKAPARRNPNCQREERGESLSLTRAHTCMYDWNLAGVAEKFRSLSSAF